VDDAVESDFGAASFSPERFAVQWPGLAGTRQRLEFERKTRGVSAAADP